MAAPSSARGRYIKLTLGLSAVALVGLVGLWIAPGCNPRKPNTTPAVGAAAEDPEPPGPPVFEDVTASSGVRHTYDNGEQSNPRALTILESLGGGAALID